MNIYVIAGHQEKWQLKNTVIIFDFYIYLSVKIVFFLFAFCSSSVHSKDYLRRLRAFYREGLGDTICRTRSSASLHRFQHHIEFSTIGALNHTDLRTSKNGFHQLCLKIGPDHWQRSLWLEHMKYIHMYI